MSMRVLSMNAVSYSTQHDDKRQAEQETAHRKMSAVTSRPQQRLCMYVPNFNVEKHLYIVGGENTQGNESSSVHIPYFSIDNAHLMYNAHPKLFRHSF